VAAFALLAAVSRGNNKCVGVIAICTMCESTEQHICLKFCFKIGKPATETYQLSQQACGEDAVGLTEVFDWFRRFKEGRIFVESDPLSGRPSTSRNEEMIAECRIVIRHNRRLTVGETADGCGIAVGSCDRRLTVGETADGCGIVVGSYDRRLTVGETADGCGISVGSCDAILTDDLHKKRVCAKFVRRLLTDDQREQRQTIARDLFERSREDVPCLKNTVTGDGSWAYGYDPETRQQSSQWKGPTTPQPKKWRQGRSKTKVMLPAFFDSESIVHHEYALRTGQTINKELYVEVLRRLRE